MPIKVGQYFWQNQIPAKCDSCDNNATHKIYAEKNGEYQVGIRACDDCYKELKEEIKNG